MPNTILSIKWGTAFGASDVNMLYRACRAHSERPLRFVCLTDNAEGLDQSIETRPIPDIGLTPEEWRYPGVWAKLSLFSDDLSDLGRVLFLDLDMMIVGDLAPFFEPREGAVFQNMGESWRPNPRSDEKITGTCLFSYDPAAEPQVLRTFLSDKRHHMETWTNEQEFAGAHVSKASFWPDDHVVSFKRHLCHRYGKGLFVNPEVPPSTARVVAFHGTPRPAETMANRIWGPAPHWHAGRVPWIEDYFRRFGSESTGDS